MKAIKVLFLILLCNAVTAAPVTIPDAIKNKLLKAEMKGAGGHNGKCISMKLKNLTAKALSVTLKAGYIFLASDTTKQDMLLTEDIFVKLEPNKEKTLLIYAMCSEKNNGSPSSTTFRIGNIAKGHLKGLADLIFKRKVQNSTGQAAVWCITDNQHMSTIEGDTADVRVLREFVAKATGQKMEPQVIRKRVVRPAPKRVYRLTGSFDFSIQEARSIVTIRLKDSQGNIIKTWVDKATYMKGHHVESYELSGENMDPGDYFIELIIDDVTVMNRKLKIPAL